jgi:hypothetical protein
MKLVRRAEEIEQYGFAEGEYGVAETLSKAKNTGVGGMVSAGLLASRGGKVRLLRPDELPTNWDPTGARPRPGRSGCRRAGCQDRPARRDRPPAGLSSVRRLRTEEARGRGVGLQRASAELARDAAAGP